MKYIDDRVDNGSLLYAANVSHRAVIRVSIKAAKTGMHL